MSDDAGDVGDHSGHSEQARDLVERNRQYATRFPDGDLPGAPTREVAVVTCMDSRIDPFAILGLRNGEAHVIRNAGGVITDDVIRSLCLSQRFLGTREVVLIHHTDCGLQKVDEAEFRNQLADEVGVTPPWSLEAFTDPHADVRQSIRRLRMTPFMPYRDHIAGFVYDVTDGLLHAVTAA